MHMRLRLDDERVAKQTIRCDSHLLPCRFDMKLLVMKRACCDSVPAVQLQLEQMFART